MRKIFEIILLLVACMVGGHLYTVKNSYSKDEQIQDCNNRYDSFLKGEISAPYENNENSKINIEQVFLPDLKSNKFTMFDVNHDGIPELHLSSMREYIILESIHDELIIIYSGSGYENLLNNGALLYCRSGGGPEHTSYRYIEIEEDNKIVDISFEKYNTMNDDKDDDLYLFENAEVTKSDYDSKTYKFLSVGSDLIEWTDYLPD